MCAQEDTYRYFWERQRYVPKMKIHMQQQFDGEGEQMVLMGRYGRALIRSPMKNGEPENMLCLGFVVLLQGLS